jgi:hypothetical protein
VRGSSWYFKSGLVQWLGSRDTFIYEYVGDVVSNPTFIKRMREYAEDGIKHFYFMMLQKDEVSSRFCWGGFTKTFFLFAL